MKASTFRFSFLLALALAASLRAEPLIVTATFQQGVGGYTGSFDRKISPTGSVDANGADIDTDSASYFLDGGSSPTDTAIRHGLLRFDDITGGSGVPSGAMVISATIDAVTNMSTDAETGDAYNVYPLTTAFDGSSTWAAPFGGDGLAGDVGGVLGTFHGMTSPGTAVSARVDKAVQSWVDGTSTNLGFGIRADRGTNGWSLNTTGASTVANRPRLTVNYTLDPFVEVTSYQEGVGSYAGTTDLRFNSDDGSAADGSTQQELFIDGFQVDNPETEANEASPDQSYLIRFDGIDLNYRQIHRAELVMKSGFASANADSAGPFTVHQVLKDWSTSTTYAELDSNGDPTVNGPLELVAGGTIAAPATSVTGIQDTEVMYIDVTSIVENWRAGEPNYGLYIGTPSPADGGTANGWQIFLSGASDPNFRPELRMIGILIPEPATMTILLAATILAPSIQGRGRKRSGHNSALL
jgi:hypothetical protein